MAFCFQLLLRVVPQPQPQLLLLGGGGGGGGRRRRRVGHATVHNSSFFIQSLSSPRLVFQQIHKTHKFSREYHKHYATTCDISPGPGFCSFICLAPLNNSVISTTSSSSSSLHKCNKRFYYIRRKPKALKVVSSDYSCFEVKGVTYRPPGTQHNLLNDVNFSLHEKSLGLIFGRSGSGKTTLLQLLAGLSKPTSGSIYIQRYGEDGNTNQAPEHLPPERVGIVFQFPERFFLADTVLEEVTFGWPRQRGGIQLKEQLASGLQRAINSVGLNGISLDEDPHALSGGYKRRLALAIQLVQKPDLLILDEPLAGLDWKARADVVKLLTNLKKELTLLVVSHDLKELSSLVDQSWRMEMGGFLKKEPAPV